MKAAGRIVTVLGAGSWGVTLARTLAENGVAVRLWCFLPEELAMLRTQRERVDILPGIVLPGDVEITDDVGAAVTGATAVVFAVPSHGVRAVARAVAPWCGGGPVVVTAAKGLEEGTQLRMTQILEQELSGRAGGYVAFSGPSHAEEVSRRVPTAVVSASTAAAVIVFSHRKNIRRMIAGEESKWGAATPPGK